MIKIDKEKVIIDLERYNSLLELENNIVCKENIVVSNWNAKIYSISKSDTEEHLIAKLNENAKVSDDLYYLNIKFDEFKDKSLFQLIKWYFFK